MGYAQGEESEVESQIKALADNGVSVVVAAGKFGDLYIHFLNKYKIMGVRFEKRLVKCFCLGLHRSSTCGGCVALWEPRRKPES